MRLLALALLLAACHRAPATDATPGGRLEAAAVARGLLADPAKASLPGVWAREETDRLCVVPSGTELRIGASVDYGEGQSCAASGTVERRGDRLRISFGDCRFDAAFDGEHIAFPALLPESCARYCSGRASLTALAVDRLSESMSEATSLRGAKGQPLCAE